MMNWRKKGSDRFCMGRSVCVWLLVCGLSLCFSGCPVIGPIIGQFTGRRSETVTVEARYELAAGDLLILVDSPIEVTETSGVGTVLSRELSKEIEVHDLKPTVIPFGALSNFRAGRVGLISSDVSVAGRELSAGQVLYVKVVGFKLGTLVDEPTGRGLMRARVKVLDVEHNRWLWPEDEPLGHEVIVRTGFREATGADYRQDFIEELCEETAVRIIKLFREHTEPRESWANSQ